MLVLRIDQFITRLEQSVVSIPPYAVTLPNEIHYNDYNDYLVGCVTCNICPHTKLKFFHRPLSVCMGQILNVLSVIAIDIRDKSVMTFKFSDGRDEDVDLIRADNITKERYRLSINYLSVTPA